MFPAAHHQTGAYPCPGTVGFLLVKAPVAVPQGGKLLGTSHQTHPFLSTYKTALPISTNGHLLRRLTTSNGSIRYWLRAQRSDLDNFQVKIAKVSIL